MRNPESLAALHTHTHTHTSVLLNNKKTESLDSLIVVPQNKNCGATFFVKNKKTICNDEINSIENKKSKKYKLIKLITMCAIMMLFNVAFSNLAYALEIGTATEFINFTNSVSTSNTYAGQTVNINADINLNNTPLTPMNGFAGTLDGKGHTISGININSSESYVGLFSQITASASIRNLTICGNITNTNQTGYSGGFIGYATGNVIIENCVNATFVSGCWAGGFIGELQAKTPKISNSYNIGAICGVQCAGGLIRYSRFAIFYYYGW